MFSYVLSAKSQPSQPGSRPFDPAEALRELAKQPRGPGIVGWEQDREPLGDRQEAVVLWRVSWYLVKL